MTAGWWPRPFAQVFIVKVKLDEFSWLVYRRFSQFRDLGDKVTRLVRACAVGASGSKASRVSLVRCRGASSAKCFPTRRPAHRGAFSRHIRRRSWRAAASNC